MRLYTLLKRHLTKINPVSGGGTGCTTQEEVIANLKSDLVDLIYPVGYIYISPNSTSPATLFGGTWEQLKDRFLLAAGDEYEAGSVGGEATHILTTDEIPSHTHTFTGSSVTTNNTGAHTHTVRTGASQSGSAVGLDSYPTLFKNAKTDSGGALSSGAHTHTYTAAGTNASTGDGSAHNNMPPYLTVYMWKRTG